MDLQIQEINNSTDFETLDELLIGKDKAEVEKIIAYSLESKSDEEYVYVLRTYFFGLFKKRLHLFFHKGLVYEYYIGI